MYKKTKAEIHQEVNSQNLALPGGAVRGREGEAYS